MKLNRPEMPEKIKIKDLTIAFAEICGLELECDLPFRGIHHRLSRPCLSENH